MYFCVWGGGVFWWHIPDSRSVNTPGMCLRMCCAGCGGAMMAFSSVRLWCRLARLSRECASAGGS